ncbi:MAG: hypothetical protein A3H39_18000 [candidate division NC10 bacterium RIFCSPLOWO2_02_FULL_66_22]|nr:MAG: hypothetical protein A3H39_18000 [candidate division NC10 bacterium RIFCSPLOWO2_02_FULL_66_22]
MKPVVGGLLVVVLGYALPQVYGTGFHVMEAALEVRLPIFLLVLLGPAKILGTSLTLGSGGVFAPSLFIGSMIGGLGGR